MWRARQRAVALEASSGSRLHSLPSYHGYLLAAAALIGGLALAIAAALALGVQSPFTAVAALAGAALAAVPLYGKAAPDFRARNWFERVVLTVLVLCSAVAVLTTIGIVFSVLWETLIFFRSVSPVEFLFNTKWAPTGTPPSFGFLPLLAGTFLITFIAIIVAGPLGLLSAIYMAEYASPRLRSTLKPLAGDPRRHPDRGAGLLRRPRGGPADP